MTINSNYDRSHNLLRAVVHGTLTTEDIRLQIKRLVDGNIEIYGLIEIIDMNQVEDLVIRYSDLVEIKKSTETLQARGHKVAILHASEPRSKEILNMLIPIFHQIRPSIYICETEEEAQNYLQALSQ